MKTLAIFHQRTSRQRQPNPLKTHPHLSKPDAKRLSTLFCKGWKRNLIQHETVPPYIFSSLFSSLNSSNSINPNKVNDEKWHCFNVTFSIPLFHFLLLLSVQNRTVYFLREGVGDFMPADLTPEVSAVLAGAGAGVGLVTLGVGSTIG